MTKKLFEVVLWEQRRIVMKIEAESKEAADAHATAVWDQIPDMVSVEYIQEVVDIDNHDVKSTIITEVKP